RKHLRLQYALSCETSVRVIRRQKCDRKKVRKCVEYLRSQGLSDCDVKKCRKQTFEEAIYLVEKLRPVIWAIAVKLQYKHTLSGPEIENIARSVALTYFTMDDKGVSAP